MEDKIPRSKDDYTPDSIVARHDFIKKKTGVAVNHVGRHSFDPSMLKAISKALSVWPKCLSE